jgi:hypothetical protein
MKHRNKITFPKSGFLHELGLYTTPQENKKGNIKIFQKEIDEDQISFARLRDQINNRFEHMDAEPFTVTQLIVGWDVMMSDTKMEMVTNGEFMRRANGKVLIAGLGLGIIVHIIQDLKAIDEIIIIEKSKDIIDMVSKEMKFNKKVKIINEDIFKWKPAAGEKFDTMWFDIWPNICSDNYLEMKELNKKFGRRLNNKNPNKWKGHWRYDDVKRQYNKDKREGWL